MIKILIVSDEAESVVIAGMPAIECTINKRYRCGVCSKCTDTVQDEQSACVEKYYNVGE